MATGSAYGSLIVVAEDAGGLAGVRDGVFADGGEGAGAIVAVLAEVFGDDGAADDDEQSEADQQDDRRLNQVCGVANQPLHCWLWESTYRTNRPVSLKSAKKVQKPTLC